MVDGDNYESVQSGVKAYRAPHHEDSKRNQEGFP